MKPVAMLCALLALLTGSAANALTSSWIQINTASNAWNAAGNWDNGVPNATGDVAVLSATLTNTMSLSMPSGETILTTLIINPAGSSQKFTFNNNALAMAAATGEAMISASNNDNNIYCSLALRTNTTLIVGSSRILFLQGAMSGPGTLTKNGAGKLACNNASLAYSGGTVLNAGGLTFWSSGLQTQCGTGPITINGGTIGQYNANYSHRLLNALVVRADFTVDGLASTNYFEMAGTMDLGSSTRTVTSSGAYTNVFITGAISGSGGLTKAGGPMVINGTNTYSGPTTIASGKLFVNGVLDNGMITLTNSSTLDGQGGRIYFNNGDRITVSNATLNATGLTFDVTRLIPSIGPITLVAYTNATISTPASLASLLSAASSGMGWSIAAATGRITVSYPTRGTLVMLY